MHRDKRLMVLYVLQYQEQNYVRKNVHNQSVSIQT